jgi:hypothetical protein
MGSTCQTNLFFSFLSSRFISFPDSAIHIVGAFVSNPHHRRRQERSSSTMQHRHHPKCPGWDPCTSMGSVARILALAPVSAVHNPNHRYAYLRPRLRPQPPPHGGPTLGAEAAAVLRHGSDPDLRLQIEHHGAMAAPLTAPACCCGHACAIRDLRQCQLIGEIQLPLTRGEMREILVTTKNWKSCWETERR